jgi:hypothetical protein
MSAYDNIRRRHPEAHSIWAEMMGGWTRFTVVDPEGATTYSQIDGESIYTNDRTKQRHYVFRG